MAQGENLIKLFLYNYLERIENDFDVMVAIVGERGSGKSTLSLRMAELLLELPGSDLNFDPEENIYYDLYQLQQDLLDLRRTILIVDEAAVQLFSRDFAKDVNKEIVKTIQIARDQNNVIFWVFPHFKHIDKGVRFYMYHIWKTRAVKMQDGRYVRMARPYVVETDYINDWYKIAPAKYKSEYGDYRVTPWLTFNLPRQDWWEIYQRKKQEFKMALVGQTQPRKREYRNARELIIKLIKSDPDTYSALLDPDRNPEKKKLIEKIAGKFGYTPRHLYRVIKSL